MHICLLTPSFPPMVDGGVAIATGRLVTRLQRHGHCVTVLTTPPRHTTVTALASPAVVRPGLRVIYDLVPDPLRTPDRLDPLYGWLQRQHQQRPFDVLLAYYAYPSGYLATFLGKRLDLPVVCSCRGNDVSKDVFIDPDTLAVVLQDSARLIFVSASLLHMADALVPCRHKATVVANSVDCAAFTPAPGPGRTGQAPVIIGTSGLMRWKKGLDLFLPLVQALSATRNVRFHVAGYPLDALVAQQISDFLARNNLRQRLIFLGPLRHDHMAAALRRMDIYVSTSYQEGTPNGVLEAMACALPVVATTADGIPQLVEDGVTGYLCAVGDLPALVSRCQLLIDRPAWRTNLGLAGRRRAQQRFDPDREAADVAAVLQLAISPSSAHLGSRHIAQIP